MIAKTHLSARLLLLGVLAVAGLSACGKEQAAAEAGEGARSAVAVTVAESRRQEVRVELHSVGRLISRNTPTLAAEIDGRVVEVLADEGEAVVAGDDLIHIDTTALELARQEAQAGIQQLAVSIANEERRVGRYRDLQTRDVMPQERLDDAEAQLAVFRASMAAAEARLAIVEDRLNKARLVAPVSGVVERRFVSVGDFVKVGSPLLSLTDTRALRAELPFSETVGAQLRQGQKLHLRSALAPDLQVEAQVDEIRPQLGPMSRALLVIANVDNPGPWRPEATVDGVAVVQSRPDAVVVPVLSVVKRPAGDVVYLLVEGEQPSARQQLVKVGARQDGWIEILSGLDAGAKVIAEGAHYLSDGAPVNVTEVQP
jgi:RND family efflux transporter MFP subunit